MQYPGIRVIILSNTTGIYPDSPTATHSCIPDLRLMSMMPCGEKVQGDGWSLAIKMITKHEQSGPNVSSLVVLSMTVVIYGRNIVGNF